MSDLVIQRVATSRQKKQFLQFPWTLYKGDPYWIPPLRDNQKEMVNYTRHPFYDRNTIQTFLAYRGEKFADASPRLSIRGISLNITTDADSGDFSIAATIKKRPTGCSTPCAVGWPIKTFTPCEDRPIRR